MRSKLSSLVCAALLVVGLVATANATPVVNSTASMISETSWLYSYEIANLTPTTGVVFDLYVPAWGDISNVTSPEGWYDFGGFGFVQWTADLGYEVAEGDSLAGFSFESTYAPAFWSGIQLTTDDGLDIVTYDVMGLQPVPEPTTIIYALSAIGIGAGFIGFRQRKSMR